MQGLIDRLDRDSLAEQRRLTIPFVRTRLSDEFCNQNGVENDPIRDEDTLFVCLEFRDEIGVGYPTGLNFYPFHKAFWNPSRESFLYPKR